MRGCAGAALLNPRDENKTQVQRRRPIIHPNEGFLFALAQYELDLFGSSSVAGSGDKRWNFYKWNAMKAKVPRYGGEAPSCCLQ